MSVWPWLGAWKRRMQPWPAMQFLQYSQLLHTTQWLYPSSFRPPAACNESIRKLRHTLTFMLFWEYWRHAMHFTITECPGFLGIALPIPKFRQWKKTSGNAGMDSLVMTTPRVIRQSSCFQLVYWSFLVIVPRCTYVWTEDKTLWTLINIYCRYMPK